YGVNITATSGSIGHYRYLLWDIVPTDEKDPFGNTFFSEIDVVDQHPAAEPESRATVVENSAHRKTIQAEGGCEIVMDTTGATDLTEWSDRELVPMIKEWYPKIVAMLPSENYTAPKRLSVAIREMDGVAFTSGTRISCSAEWMRRELKGEAMGAVFHELVHVVQQYGRARRNNRSNGPSSGWIVEGIPDYVRWYIYEPQTRGAEISERNIARARYDGSYRISANFLNWVVQNHDKELIRKLNAVMREGEYREELWNTWTGRTVQELGDQWKAALAAKVAKP
ncbi:MAG TPA: basic secretory protein-like protein, partial [Clostridia bacterium]|nr:basic secretory protein-like protein [Clostridia bacterium]